MFARRIGNFCENAVDAGLHGIDSDSNAQVNNNVVGGGLDVLVITGTRYVEMLDDVLAILVVFVTVTVMMGAAVAHVIRVDGLAIGMLKEGNHEHMTIVMVDVDVKADNPRQIYQADEDAGYRLEYFLQRFHY